METSRHLVARQTIEVVAFDRSIGESMAARTSDAAGRLAAAIEAGLDAIDNTDARLQLDRVELDLGPCDPARWEEALVDGIREGLAKKVVDAFKRCGTGDGDGAATALRLLEAFARTGRIPWWCAATDTPGSAIAALVPGGDPQAVRAILAWPTAIERFVSQLDEHRLIGLLQLARPDLSPEAVGAIANMARADSLEARATAGRQVTRAAVWRAILAEAAGAPGAAGSGPPNPDPVAGHSMSEDAGVRSFQRAVAARLADEGPGPALHSAGDASAPAITGRHPADRHGMPDTATGHEERAAALSARLKALARENPSVAAVFMRFASLVPQLGGPALSAAEAAVDAEAGPPTVLALIHLFADVGLIGRVDAERWRKALVSAMAASDDTHDALALVTAGLPLVAPFLPAFFGELELLDEEQFRSLAARHRAAAILHYLASGAVAAPEQDLPLAKALAGINFDEVYDAGEPLTDFEIASGEALLEALLGHAPMFGRIGIAGLREAYLMRPGLLTTRDGHWLLRVERRSIDVLIDRLPWSFGWVRLPWMQAPLQVEW